ncbi:MAG TPA: DUF2497 domain-containing protein [Xanthobacteraceae bacterium]|nr:DUF2497 domain-containing protein [Xanthobacteraceae bacterium]
MTQAAKAQEPSMEEILASIRRIIADDDAGKSKPEAARARTPTPAPAPPQPAVAAAPPPPPPAPRMEEPPPVVNEQPVPPPVAEFEPPPPPPPLPPEPEPEPEPVADVLDLTEEMVAPAPPAFRKIEPAQDLAFEPPPPEPEPMPEPEPIPEPPQATVEVARRQFHHETGDDRSLLSPSTTAAVDAAFNTLANTVLVQNSRTLDDLVREMLRPMLKAWLDDNLPNMVERLVRAEIERVARGRG